VFDKVKATRPGTLVGVLGCMAERLKSKLLDEEKLVDLVIGPDAYRDLPKLVAEADDGEKGDQCVFLSREENLCGHQSDAPGLQWCDGFHLYHARVRQYVLFLCGAFYQGAGAKP
jgi:tRNA A37 methylthiotransferase MiaB